MILWIDKNTFATSLLEKVFKKSGKEFYAIPSVEDFAYLVEDLKPKVIVLDEETYHTHEAKFLKQYKSSTIMQQTPFIFLDEKKGMDFTEKKVGALNRPLDPFRVPEQIEKILNNH